MGRGAVGPLGRVLLIDLRGEAGLGLEAPLRASGFVVHACADAKAGLEGFVRVLPDLIVVGSGSETEGVIALVERIRELSDVPLIVVGAGEPVRRAIERMPVGADRFVAAGVAGEALGEAASELVAARPATSASPVADRARPRMTATHVRQVAREALRRELERQLWACRGNLAEVGRRMGRDRSTIRYHLRRFGMLTDGAGEPPASAAGPHREPS